MWRILLLVGLAAVASADVDQYKERRFQYLVSSQNLHVEKLLKDLHELEEEFNKLSHDVDAKDVKHLKARVANLEHTGPRGCPEHQAQCGGDVPECINDLLFCDGHKDCKNGRDEDDEVCSLDVTHVGSSYSGVATWESCETAEPHHAVVTITASERKEFFPARVFVRGVLAFEEDEHDHHVRTYALRGYYNFGRRALILGPERGTKPIYGVRCHFDLGDDDHADCHIVVPSSLHECAHFSATRH